jgi:putative flavoprotein involved in K+ transport
MTPSTDSAERWLRDFDAALQRGDAEAAAALFHDDGCWRDLTSFTWSIRSLEGRAAIADMLRATLATVRPVRWSLDGTPAEAGEVVEVWLRFETSVGRGRAVLRLKDGRAWTLMTMLAELAGHEEPAGERRPLGVQHGAYGTGQRSWLETYASIMELDVWGATTCVGARRDEADGTWRVTVERDGETLELWPAQLVLATGLSGLPQHAPIPGAARFEGTQLHSSAYAGGAPWKDRHCVVIGSNNSAHDICADLWEHGARVTMLQRSSTMVARSETLEALGWGKLFSEDALRRGVSTECADMTLASMPYRLLARAQAAVTTEIARRDAAFYERLRAAGFMLDFGEDGSGLSMKYLRRGSGDYIDVGASELVADGRIGLRSGVSVRELRARSVVLDDGSELPADLLVHATGFGPLSEVVARLVSPEVAERIGPIWGLGSGTARDPGPWAGELRNMWTPTAQPGLWIHGGNLQQSRFYSLQLALQLKARHAGIPTPVYGGAGAA